MKPLRLNRRAFTGGALSVLWGCGDDDPGEGTPPEPAEACTPAQVGGDPDFVSARDPSAPQVDTARLVADHFLAIEDPTTMPWDWGESVVMFALVDLYRLTGEARYRDFYQAWLDRHIREGYDFLVTSSDRCPPALSAVALYDETCDPKYRQVVERVLLYLDDEALRTEEGGLNHLGVEDLFGVSLWLDSLFMFGNVWTRWAERTGEGRYLDDFSEQYRIFTDLLQDDGGWMMHAHDWPVSEQDPGVYWGRGNAWVTAAGYDYLRVRQQRGESDEAVAASLRAQVDAILAAQDEATGLWWTIVNRPGETYLETSCAALFAAGMARGHRLGLLGDEVLPSIDAALQGILTQVEADGTVNGVSGPTTVGDFEHYRDIPVVPDIHYGVGSVILACIETSGLV